MAYLAAPLFLYLTYDVSWQAPIHSLYFYAKHCWADCWPSSTKAHSLQFIRQGTQSSDGFTITSPCNIGEKILATMDMILQTPSIPVAISDDGIGKGETALTMQCHDRTFHNITVLGEAGEKIFTVESKGSGSLSWRRTVKDTSGNHLFDLRHIAYTMKNKWVVESPSGREICTLRHPSSLSKERSAFDMVVLNEADKGSEVKVEVRPNDRSAITTTVNIDGSAVAEIRILESNDVVNLKDKDRSVWRARVAGGVDRALVSTNMLSFTNC